MSTDLLKQIERYCAAHGISTSAFGRAAVGDARLVKELRGGRKLHRETHFRVIEFLRGNAVLPAKRFVRVIGAPQKPYKPENAGDPEEALREGSNALLKALWGSHADILRFAEAAGRKVEAPA